MNNSSNLNLKMVTDFQETRIIDQSTRIIIKHYSDREQETFQAILEKQTYGAWKTIACYEINPDHAVRYINRCNGSSLIFRLNIPNPIIRNMALTDFIRNWKKYSAEYDGCKWALKSESLQHEKE